MTDFVRDDVSLGEIAASPESITKSPVKREVDVNAPIFRAIKRTAGCAGESAAGPRLITEENQLRLLVPATHLAKDGVPRVFGISQDNGDELGAFVAGSVRIGRP